jgi:hypothetical protein
VRQNLTSTAENVTGGVNSSRLSVANSLRPTALGYPISEPYEETAIEVRDRAIMSLGYPISEQVIEVNPHSQELVVSKQSELIVSKQSQSLFNRTTRYDLESGDRDNNLAPVLKTI